MLAPSHWNLLSSEEDVCAEKDKICFPWVVPFLVLNGFTWGNKLFSQ